MTNLWAFSNRLQTPATPRFVDRLGALSATLGLATLGLGTHQSLQEGDILCLQDSLNRVFSLSSTTRGSSSFRGDLLPGVRATERPRYC